MTDQTAASLGFGPPPSIADAPRTPAANAAPVSKAPANKPPVSKPRTPAPRKPKATPAPKSTFTIPEQRTSDVPAQAVAFAELGVPDAVCESLRKGGIESAFPIQVATLPDTLQGRDVLGRGRTGSGKTLAFSIPVVARLAASKRPRQARKPRSLVLAPTRELANQINATLQPLAASLGLKTTVVFGGVGQNPQVEALKAGVDVLVACPGRLEDLIQQGHCDLGSVEVTVLDEADHMADLGFLPGVKRLLDRTPDGQRMLFSATLDNGVGVLVDRYLKNPLTHSVSDGVPAVMTHYLFDVDETSKPDVIEALAAGQGRTVFFTRTKHRAKQLAKRLTKSGIPAVDLHGNLSQNAREKNLAAFSSGAAKVLVATDIAARGIHVDEVGLVVHVDPPSEHKAYLHRSGRTARAGAEGIVVTLVLPEERRDVQDLVRLAKIQPKRSKVTSESEIVAELVGAPAERVAYQEPVAAPVTQRKKPAAQPQQRRRSRR